MPPQPKIKKEDIIKSAFHLIQQEGIEHLNARLLAKTLNCSTQPIYRHYATMEDLKKEVKERIDVYYHDFMLQYIDPKQHLYSESLGYIEFARKERFLFEALFLTSLAGSRNVDQVLHSSWNQETIEDTKKQYQIDLKKAQELYRDIRFYSHGIATQIFAKSIILNQKEVEELLKHAIEKFLMP